MKATDLMIGDWMKTPLGIGKVTAIDAACLPDFQTARVFHKKRQEYQDAFVDIDKVRPIPLTPEILEKNGFDGTYKKTYQIYKSDGYDKLYISYWRGRLTIITSPDIRKKHSTNRIHIDCSYVHELQHCLSLFGIEKEIIL